MKKFRLNSKQRKIVKKIQEDNAHKVLKTDMLGNMRVDINATALQQNLEYLINRARQITKRDVA